MNKVTRAVRPSVLRSTFLANGELAWPLAEKNGISEVTFRARLKNGMLPDQAATLPIAIAGGFDLSIDSGITEGIRAALLQNAATPDFICDWLRSFAVGMAKAEKYEALGNSDYAQKYRATAERCLHRVASWRANQHQD